MEKMEKFSLYLKNKGIKFTTLTFDLIYYFCLDIFCNATTSLSSPFFQRSKEKSFRVLEAGTLDGQYDGFWVEDDETGVAGFFGSR